jgi:hypothetical protein
VKILTSRRSSAEDAAGSRFRRDPRLDNLGCKKRSLSCSSAAKCRLALEDIMKRLLPSSAASPLGFACTVIVLVMCLSACDTGGTSVGLLSEPSTQSFLTASIAPRSNAAAEGFVSVGCSLHVGFELPFDLTITAVDTASIDHVTIHMIDGTNLGGPMITFPRPDLISRFGTTVIPAGSTRVFPFAPVVSCGGRHPSAIAADITFLMGAGRTRQMTVVGSLQ